MQAERGVPYRASSHMAEQRGTGDFAGKPTDTDDPLVFVLTGIAWREAWKYGDRAVLLAPHRALLPGACSRCASDRMPKLWPWALP
jgi:hypothetical protein